MLRSYNYILLVIGVLGFCRPLFGTEYETELHLTVENGLPSNETYYSFVSEKGDVWICTDEGLAKFDGENVTAFSEMDGLSGRAVFKGVPDIMGKYWLLTSGGISVLKGDSIYTPKFNKVLVKHPQYSLLKDITITDEGVVYATTVAPNTGMFKIQDGKVSFIKFPDHIRTGCYEQVFGVELENGAVIQGLLKTNYSKECHDGIQKMVLANNDVNNIIATNQKNLGPGNNIYCISKDSESVLVSIRNKLVNIGLNKINISCLFKSDILFYKKVSNQIYVSIRGSGIVILDTDLNLVDTLINSGAISFFHITQSGKLFICDLESGIIVLSPSSVITIKLPNQLKYSIVAKPFNMVGKHISIYSAGTIIFGSISERNEFVHKSTKHVQYSLKSLEFKTSIWRNDTIYFNHGYISLSDSNSLRYIEEYNPTFQVKYRFWIDNNRQVFSTVDGLMIKEQSGLRMILSYEEVGIVHSLRQNENRLIIGSDKGLFVYSIKTESLEMLVNESTKEMIEFESGVYLVLKTTNEILLFAKDTLVNLNLFYGRERVVIESINCLENRLIIGTNTGLYFYDLSKFSNKSILEYDRFIKVYGIRDVLVSNSKEIIIDRGSEFCKLILDEYEHNEVTNLIVDSVVSSKDFHLEAGTYKHSFDVRLKNTAYFYLTLNNALHDNMANSFYYRVDKIDTSWKVSYSPRIVIKNIYTGRYKVLIKGRSERLVDSELSSINFVVSSVWASTYWYVTIAIVIVFLVALLILFGQSGRSFHNHRKDILMAELKQFSLKMNPHFLFNSLNSLRSHLYNYYGQDPSSLVDAMSIQLREVMDSLEHRHVSLNEELRRVEEFLRLEQIKSTVGFDYSISYPNGLNLSELEIPPMVIQPLVENSIKHGFDRISKPGVIRVEVSFVNKSLIILVYDNGVGVSSLYGAIENNSSRALRNIMERFNTLKQLEHKEYSIELLQNRLSGTSILIKIEQ